MRLNRSCLYQHARRQFGLFSADQAQGCRYSPKLLTQHTQRGDFVRLTRGVYKLAGHTPHPREELLTLWHRLGRTGVFGGETALALHGLLSDTTSGRGDVSAGRGDMPASGDMVRPRVHLVLPPAWHDRRILHGRHVVLHFADVAPADQTIVDYVPTTTILRTLHDCIDWDTPLEILQRAGAAVRRRGIMTDHEWVRLIRREPREASR